MARKMIADREKAILTLDSALEAHGPLLVEGLEAFFAPVLEEGEELPDFELLIALMRRTAAHRRDRMVETEHRWQDLKVERGRLRRALERARKVVRKKLTSTRKWLSGLIGRKAVAAKMGVGGDTPRDVTGLLLAGWRLHGNLDGSEQKSSALRFEADTLAAELQELLENLDENRTRLTETDRAVETAVIEKQRAFDANNEAFVGLAALTVTFFRMSGHPELARAVQPSRRRPGLTLPQGRMRKSSS